MQNSSRSLCQLLLDVDRRNPASLGVDAVVASFAGSIAGGSRSLGRCGVWLLSVYGSVLHSDGREIGEMDIQFHLLAEGETSNE